MKQIVQLSDSPTAKALLIFQLGGVSAVSPMGAQVAAVNRTGSVLHA